MGDSIINSIVETYKELNEALTAAILLKSFCALLSICLVHILLVRPFLSPLRKIPGMPYIPIIGNMRAILTGEAMQATIEMLEKHGLVMRYYFFGGRERICVGDPAALKHILVTNCKNYIKPPERMVLFRKVFGNGLITSEGNTHAQHKKLMSPAFNQSSILKMIPIFNKYTKIFVEIYSEKICNANDLQGGASGCASLQLPVHRDLVRLTLDIIGKAAFGCEFNSTKDGDNIISMAFHRIATQTGLNWKVLLPYFHKLPFKELKELTNSVTIAHNEIQKMIEFKNTIRKNKGEEFEDSDLLDMMMSAHDETNGEFMTDQELKDQVITIMLAGHETTALALSWCLLTLAQNPAIQDRARKEVVSCLGESDEFCDITLEQLDEMDYISAVCKETLRFLPPVPITLRQALSDDHLCGHFIPKGTILLLAQGPMMRLPQIVEDPETFNPDRFLNGKNMDLYSFLPFLLGPRMCIGYKFAMIEMRLILVHLLKNFKFDPVPGLVIKRRSGGITMRPNPALELLVKKA